jgi:hypothetical protein
MLNHLIDRTKFRMVNTPLSWSLDFGSRIPFERITYRTSVRAFFRRNGHRLSNTSFGWESWGSLSIVPYRGANLRKWKIQVHSGDWRLVLPYRVKRMINVGHWEKRVFDFVCRSEDQ